MTKGSLAAQSSSLPSTKSNATISKGSHHSSKTNSFCMDVIWRSTVQVANAQRTYVSYLKKYNLCDVKTGSLDYVWEGGCTGWYADQGGCSRVVSIVWLFGWNFRIYILLREKFWALVSSEIMPSRYINIQHDRAYFSVLPDCLPRFLGFHHEKFVQVGNRKIINIHYLLPWPLAKNLCKDKTLSVHS